MDDENARCPHCGGPVNDEGVWESADAERARALEGALRALVAEVEKQIKVTGVNGAVVNACRKARALLAESTPTWRADGFLWTHCRVCGEPAFRYYDWSHAGGSMQEHDVEPSIDARHPQEKR